MGLSSSVTQQIGFPYLDKFLSQHVLDRHNYCRDPFKKHRRRIYMYVHLRVASEHPSLSLRSRDLLCLKAVQKNDAK